MSTRRQFIFDFSTAAVALTLLPLTSFGQSTSQANSVKAPQQLTYATLVGQVNTVFIARLEDNQTVQLTLRKVRLAKTDAPIPGRRLPADAGNEKFSLVFSGSASQLLPSAIHDFEHAQLGRFAMHLGQIGQSDQNDVRYEAVFNMATATA